MLAIASLATGFVVAAVSPSHAVGNGPAVTPSSAPADDAAPTPSHSLGHPAVLGSEVEGALGALDPTIAKEYRLAMANAPTGRTATSADEPGPSGATPVSPLTGPPASAVSAPSTGAGFGGRVERASLRGPTEEGDL